MPLRIILLLKKKTLSNVIVYPRTIRARHSLWKKINSSDIFLGEYKADQSSMMITNKGEERIYDIFVVLYGWEANIPSALTSLTKNLLDERCFIITDETRKTKIQNIFAAGEVTHRFHPCVATAMADGVIVAKTIQFQLESLPNKHA